MATPKIIHLLACGTFMTLLGLQLTTRDRINDGDRREILPTYSLSTELPHNKKYNEYLENFNHDVPYLLIQSITGQRYHVLLQHYDILVSVRFDDLFVTVKVLNVDKPIINGRKQWQMRYSLGIGLNYAEIRYSPNSYHQSIHLITIQRRERLTPKHNLTTTCYLLQNCKLAVYEELRGSCGLQNNISSTRHFGYWKFNCTSCENMKLCDTERGAWIPQGQVRPFDNLYSHKQYIQTRLSQKNVLFLGDSTNRGLMYSVMEQLNGSLTAVEKSHGFISHSNVSQTSFTFSYYPAFWLDNQTTFAETLHNILLFGLKSSPPSSLLLVIGGVQWLTSLQLDQINKFIHKFDLSPNQIIIKSYSSGFLYPIPNMPYTHSEESMQKLILRNTQLVNQANDLHFKVVDTLQMTLSRFDEFLQGGCGCHFHKVSEVSTTSPLKERLKRLGIINDLNENSPKQYHVSGAIHESYANIILNLMCK